MTGKTHVLAGMICGAVVARVTGEPVMSIIPVAAVASLFPDIDTHTSKLGSRMKPVSTMIQLVIGHRTLFHAPLLYLLLTLGLYHHFPQYQNYIIAAAAGAGSHILLDAANPSGIPLLYPLPQRFSYGRAQTGGITDWLLTCLFSGILSYIAYRYLT